MQQPFQEVELALPAHRELRCAVRLIPPLRWRDTPPYHRGVWLCNTAPYHVQAISAGALATWTTFDGQYRQPKHLLVLIDFQQELGAGSDEIGAPARGVVQK